MYRYIDRSFDDKKFEKYFNIQNHILYRTGQAKPSKKLLLEMNPLDIKYLLQPETMKSLSVCWLFELTVEEFNKAIKNLTEKYNHYSTSYTECNKELQMKFELIKEMDNQLKEIQKELSNEKQNNSNLLIQVNQSRNEVNELNHRINSMPSEQEIYNQSLLNACDMGNLKKIKAAILLGADIEAKNINNKTPLLICIEKENDECAKYLLKKHADVKFSLEKMATEGQFLMVKKILDYMDKQGANASLLKSTIELLNQLNNQSEEHQNIKKMLLNAMLFQAAAHNNSELAQYALEQGGLVDVQNEAYSTPLHEACRHGHLKIVKYFLIKNANVDIVDCEFKKPIDIASNEDVKQCIQDHIELQKFDQMIKNYRSTQANKIQNMVKMYLQRKQYIKNKKNDEKELESQGSNLGILFFRSKQYEKASKISTALEKRNFHEVRQMLRDKPQKEIEIFPGKKITY